MPRKPKIKKEAWQDYEAKRNVYIYIKDVDNNDLRHSDNFYSPGQKFKAGPVEYLFFGTKQMKVREVRMFGKPYYVFNLDLL